MPVRSLSHTPNFPAVSPATPGHRASPWGLGGVTHTQMADVYLGLQSPGNPPRSAGIILSLRKLKKPMTHDCTRFVMGLMCPHGTDRYCRGGVRPQPPPRRRGRRVGAAHPVPTRRRFDAGRGCVDAQERAITGRAALVRRGVLTRTGMRQHGGVLTQVRPNRQRPRSDTARPGPTCAGRIERGGAALTCHRVRPHRVSSHQRIVDVLTLKPPVPNLLPTAV